MFFYFYFFLFRKIKIIVYNNYGENDVLNLLMNFFFHGNLVIQIKKKKLPNVKYVDSHDLFN